MLITLQEGGKERKAHPKRQTERGRERNDTADAREKQGKTSERQTDKQTKESNGQLIPLLVSFGNISPDGERSKKEHKRRTIIETAVGLGGIRKLKLLIVLRMLGAAKENAF